MGHLDIKEIDRFLSETAYRGILPGLNCRVIKENKVIYQNAYGYSVKSPISKKVTKNTMYDLASVTKIITSLMIFRLITEDKLTLSTKLTECLSDIRIRPELNKHIGHITVFQLLTHSSSLMAWFPFYTAKEKNFYDILVGLLPGLIQPENNEEKITYSDLNFMLLGEIIKETTSLSLQEALHELITEPLNLSSMTFGPVSAEDIAATEYGNQIEQQMCRDRGLSFREWRSTRKPIIGEANDGNAHYFWEGQAGHAGIFSTVEDVAKVAQFFLKGGDWGGVQLVNRKLVTKSMEKQAGNRGLGWSISPVFPEGAGHTGFTGPSIWVSPEKNLLAVIFTSRLHVASEPKNINDFRQTFHNLILHSLK